MQSSNRIKNYIKSKEGLRLHSYNDGTNHWAIGWGHTWRPGDKAVITEVEAQQLFDADIILAEVAVNRNIRHILLQSQFDALVDFAFNLGAGELARVAAIINQGGIIEAFSWFSRYCHSGKTPLEDLLIRRAEEILISCGKAVANY